MSKFLKSNSAKVVLGLVAFAFAFAGVRSANAYTFTAPTLKMGSHSTAVMELQKALNLCADTMVASVGAGSMGHESMTFAAKTKAAVKVWQAKMGLTADGVFGPASRAKMNTMGCGSTTNGTLPPGCTSTSGFSPITGQACNGGTTQNPTGPVGVMLSTDNPAANTIVTGSSADMAHFTFTGSGTVTSVTLQRTGVSANAALQSVYLYQGATRVGEAASVNSNGVIVFNGLNIAVNGSATIAVRADIPSGSTYSGQAVGVNLTGYTVNGTAMTANLAGNIMSITDGTGILAGVVVAQSLSADPDSGTATYNNVVGAPTINAGTTGYTVWSAPVQVSTRSVWLKGLTLRYIGSASTGSLANVKLYVDGVQAGSSAGVSANGYVTFDMTSAPMALATGSHTVEVRADITGGSARTFYLSLQNASDLMTTDSQLGVNPIVTVGGSTSFSISQGATISVNAGSATFAVDPSFQTMTNVTGGASNVVLGKFKIHGYGEDVKVMSISVTPTISSGITATGSTTNFNNLALYYNGSQVGSSTNYSGSGAVVFQLGSSMIIPAGSDSTLEVRGDLQNSANQNYTGGTVAVTVNAGSSNAQGLSSLQSVSLPAVAVVGNSLTIQTGQLVVAKNGSYTNQTMSPNTANVKIGSFTLQNQSSSESIRVTSLAVGMTTDGSTLLTSSTTPALTNFSNLRTSETSGSGSQPLGSVTAANTFNVDFTIAAGASKTIDIFADLGATASGTVETTLLPSALGSTSNVTVTPSSATAGQQITLGSGSVSAPTFVASSSTAAQFVATALSAADASKASYRFTATNGSGTISELKFAVIDSTPGTVSSIKVGSQSASVVTPSTTTLSAQMVTAATTATVASTTNIPVGSLIKIDSEYMEVTAVPSSTTLTVTRAVSGSAATHASSATVTPQGLAYLTGLNVNVPNGTGGTQVDAYMTYSPANGVTGAIASGSTSTVYLTYVKSTIGTTTTAGAVTAAAANQMTLVGSKPTVAVTSTSNAGLILSANNKIGEVTVSADAAGSIKVNDIVLTVGSSSITTAAFTAIYIADGSTAITTSDCGISGATITCEFADNLTNNSGSDTAPAESNTDSDGYLIAGGSSKTFSIYATVGGTAASSGTPTVSTTATASGFNWDDVAGNGTNLTGSSIYNFPATSYSVHS